MGKKMESYKKENSWKARHWKTILITKTCVCCIIHDVIFYYDHIYFQNKIWINQTISVSLSKHTNIYICHIVNFSLYYITIFKKLKYLKDLLFKQFQNNIIIIYIHTKVRPILVDSFRPLMQMLRILFCRKYF